MACGPGGIALSVVCRTGLQKNAARPIALTLSQNLDVHGTQGGVGDYVGILKGAAGGRALVATAPTFWDLLRTFRKPFGWSKLSFYTHAWAVLDRRILREKNLILLSMSYDDVKTVEQRPS